MNLKNPEENRFVKTAILANDMIVIMFSYWLAFALQHSWDLALSFPNALKVIMTTGALLTLPVNTLYPSVFINRKAHGDHIFARTLYVTTLITLVMYVLTSMMGLAEVMKVTLAIGAGVFFVVVFAGRFIAYQILRRARSRGRDQRKILFIGAPWYYEDLYKILQEKSFGYKVVGIFCSEELPEHFEIPALGNRNNVIDYLKGHPEISDVYLVPNPNYKIETKELFQYCEEHTLRFYVLPIFLDFLTKRMELSHLGNTSLLAVRNEPLQDPFNRFLKRCMDLAVSGTFLLTLFPPILLIVGIIIKIQSPGPIFFRQKRNGLDGKEFYCLKFRSMHVNNDADRLQATENDPRKFGFGNIMRKTNIDELPQFINVFLGDMSLVGPRPHMLLHTQEYSQLIKKYMVRHLVKPGITGWAQCQGFRGETKTLDQMENRVKADIWYVENWTFFLDIRIMWRTVMNMLMRNEKNAY